MRSVFLGVVCLFVIMFSFISTTQAAALRNPGVLFWGIENPSMENLRDWGSVNNPYTASFGSKNSRGYVAMSPEYGREIEGMLYEAVERRLGIPYRTGGIDDRGYDCSGFVWRVFQEAGIDFERTPARVLWEAFPEATAREQRLFGTLVFFRGLGHVGIVRDSVSFYHASSSQGIVRSYFSDYWADRIVGYRRVLIPVERAGKSVRSDNRRIQSPFERGGREQRHEPQRSLIQAERAQKIEHTAKKKGGLFKWFRW